MTAIEGYQRYAVYYAPEEGSALARFSASWLGYDPATGEAVERPKVDGLPEPVETLTTSPARYGFHGTLKAPFRLAEGVKAQAVDAALAEFCASEQAVAPLPMHIESMRGFVSLRPAVPVPEFNAQAFRIVQHFEPFRAPLNEAEIARRLRSKLSDRQRALLEQWGYPLVDDEFRFHLTLTVRQTPEASARIIEALSPHVAPLLAQPLPILSLCLFGDPGEGRPFRLLRRHRFGS